MTLSHVLTPSGTLSEKQRQWELILSHCTRGNWAKNAGIDNNYRACRIVMTSFSGADFAIAASSGHDVKATYFQTGDATVGDWSSSVSGGGWNNFGTSTHRQVEIAAGYGGAGFWAGNIFIDYGWWNAIGRITWRGTLSIRQQADKWFGVTVEGLRV